MPSTERHPGTDAAIDDEQTFVQIWREIGEAAGEPRSTLTFHDFHGTQHEMAFGSLSTVRGPAD